MKKSRTERNLASGAVCAIVACALLGCSSPKADEDTARATDPAPTPYVAGDKILFDEIVPTADGSAYGSVHDLFGLRDTERESGVWYLKGDKAYPVTVAQDALQESALSGEEVTQTSFFPLWHRERSRRLEAEAEVEDLSSDPDYYPPTYDYDQWDY